MCQHRRTLFFLSLRRAIRRHSEAFREFQRNPEARNAESNVETGIVPTFALSDDDSAVLFDLMLHNTSANRWAFRGASNPNNPSSPSNPSNPNDPSNPISA